MKVQFSKVFKLKTHKLASVYSKYSDIAESCFLFYLIMLPPQKVHATLKKIHF